MYDCIINRQMYYIYVYICIEREISRYGSKFVGMYLVFVCCTVFAVVYDAGFAIFRRTHRHISSC